MRVASGTITDMKKQYLLGSFIISALFVPVLANAATADEIRAQIQSLLNQITALQTQLNLVSDTPTSGTPSNVCPNLYRALSRGSRGSDVISLQRFLIAQGFLSGDSATGFFGSMTEVAVQKWQAQNSIVSYGNANTTGYGVVGARTRAAIAARCVTKPPIVQSCTIYQIPICGGGQHVENGLTDYNGCAGAPRCVNNAVSCPIYNACAPGYTTNTSTDVNGCTVRQCIPPIASLPWSTVNVTKFDVIKFTISLPSGWVYNPQQGTDSMVGEFVGDSVRLSFDLGGYIGNPAMQPNPTYTISTETIGGRSAQILIPKVSGQGEIGIYIDSDGEDLKVSGNNVPSSMQKKVLQILRSVQLKSTEFVRWPGSVSQKYTEMVSKYGQSLGASISYCKKGQEAIYKVSGSGGFTAEAHYFDMSGASLGDKYYSDVQLFESGNSQINISEYQCNDIQKSN
ncbi:MAG: hypothetical protein COV09_01615 [Candidatus Vogelbacteria bacterium CG10_big_fil_rev_8_21_14_0_10_50_13]|uniref:Peptidoglycan binding-like domain-containing protein n=1 Tax=Candidatus Vogelbacteria bacterium CG10_big_fil_rev_8_21_14_0_10_50_13 TaxID=1975044 RepID=A0A2H0RG97_9BACT|nr:MAG: hypothetical protein COV09_01615 [Candidatus Vogelbacteria bacterium CG10_big_fil_rev_8_21_14_0_10_50_13]